MKTEYKIPFGNGFMALHMDSCEEVELLESRVQAGSANEDDTVTAAMSAPIGSTTLAELATGKPDAVIICSDHTRPVPSKRIIPHLLRELRAGNPDIKITLLIATGFHRATTREELVAKFGVDIVESERIVVHDCLDESSLCNIGVLPSGAPLVINRIAADASLLVSEGFIEPHFFAGYSGGRKSVLPGVCGRATVLGNHCSAFIDSPSARTGVLNENPIHADMLAASRMAGLAYIVNVILDAEKRVAVAVAGDPALAHEEGCARLRKLCRVAPSRSADIVITSNGGAPLDQNIYQAVKGLTAAEAAAAPGAVLIISAECADGSGGESFYRALHDCASPSALLSEILRVPMDKTAPDQWEVQIMARILAEHMVILVCAPQARRVAEEMKLQTAATLDEAFMRAKAAKGSNQRVTVIPDGVSVVVKRVE